MSGDGDSVGVGDVLGDFRVIRKIGQGGMGVVYLAEDERLERKAALKVIAPHLAEDPDFRKRFIAEARSAAAIDHPNAVTVYSSGTIDGKLYMAMRYVAGTDLRAYLQKNGALEPDAAVTIVGEVAAALDAAHSVGLVHRDVKPANVILEGEPDEGGKAYLTDFGLTKGGGSEPDVQLTGTGQWVGTIDYVAPEQITAGTIDARADVYALGCVLYEAVTGSVPFAGNDMQKMWGHVNEEFPSLDAEGTEALAAVIERATAKDPDDRFPSAGDLALAAAAALDGAEVDVPEHSVATGAAARGLSEAATTRKLPKQGLAPTVAGRPKLPARQAARPQPAPPPPRRPPASSGGGSSSSRTAAIIGGAVVIAAGLLAAAVVIAGQGDSGTPGGAATVASQLSENGGGERGNPGGGSDPSQQQRPQESAPAIPPDAEACENGVSVRASSTTCPFGFNVAREYRRCGGCSEFEAFSPVTGITYPMYCSGSVRITCTGGRDAAVYIDPS